MRAWTCCPWTRHEWWSHESAASGSARTRFRGRRLTLRHRGRWLMESRGALLPMWAANNNSSGVHAGWRLLRFSRVARMQGDPLRGRCACTADAGKDARRGKNDVSYQDRGGSVERSRSDHRIKAAEAEQRALLIGSDEARRTASPTVLEGLKALLRRGWRSRWPRHEAVRRHPPARGPLPIDSGVR